MLDLRSYQSVVVFSGAGLSAESGLPTYRGQGGVWSQYRWEEYACQRAFEHDPEKVWEFHDERRAKVAACEPNAGHLTIAAMEAELPRLTVVTQNIDGLHQRAGSRNVIELHGSLWRVRCDAEGKRLDAPAGTLGSKRCDCGGWLRPDIVWFGDPLDMELFTWAESAIEGCDLFLSVGTSGAVYPAAYLPELAAARGIPMVEINSEQTTASSLYAHHLRGPASEMLSQLWDRIS